MDKIEVIQTTGTIHSRKEKYIHSTWNKSRCTKYMLYGLGLSIFLIILYSSSSRSSYSSSSSRSSANEDGDDASSNKKKHPFDHDADDGVNGMRGEYAYAYPYAHLQINDYTNLNSNILHAFSFTQNSILKKINKSCLKQSLLLDSHSQSYNKISQEEMEMICN